MLTKADHRFFMKAQRVAILSDYPNIHIGCVAVYHGRVIGMGFNCNKTHTRQKYYNKYRINSDNLLAKLHAEINCINSIRHLDIVFSKVKLYLYRIRADQSSGMARPCPSCMAAIKDLGIRDVYYTTNDGYVHEIIKNIDVGGVA